MFGLGPLEIVVIGSIAVMLYGKRLPEVGRSAGKTLGELRRQWTTLAKELDVAAHIEGRTPRPAAVTRYASDEADSRQVSAPRFDPPPASETTA
jgi:sec-independent protein translocase protein TatA